MAKRKKQSIITPLKNKCYLCGKYQRNPERHLIVDDWWNRKLSERYGLTVPLCQSCHKMVHEGGVADMELKLLAQVVFREKFPDKDFVELFGKDFLDEKMEHRNG